jgi:hypothetical protein
MYNTTYGTLNLQSTHAYLISIANVLSISTNGTGAVSKVAALLQQRQNCSLARLGFVGRHAQSDGLRRL